MIHYAWQALKICYQPKSNFKKAGIMAVGLQPEGQTQLSIFQSTQKHFKHKKLMGIVDGLNARYGKGTVGLAACKVTKGNQWQRLEEFRSPRYTTNWGELLII